MIRTVLTDPHHVTAGYTGAPGDRTFFIQAEDPEERVSVVCEKEQVAGLAELLIELLARIDDAPVGDWDRTAMDLREPIEPIWQVEGISVGLDPERSMFVIELSELVREEEREAEEIRIWANLDQVRRLAAHAAEVVAEGRPRCRFCGRPEDPDGHVCPATNGHGRLSR